MSRFTRIPASTFQELQVNVGVLAKDFDPATGALSDEDIITATTGGITVNVNSEYEDFGDDIDNCPKNTKELKRKTSTDINVTTTALNINQDTLMFSLGAADVRSDGAVVTRKDLALSDFKTIWWVGDMADGGFVAVKLIDALSTAGFSLKTTDKGKGNVSITLTAHGSLNNQDVEPVEFYIVGGDDLPSVQLNRHNLTIEDGSTETLVATTNPSGATVTWASSNTSVATVSGGVVTAEAEGVCVIIATITQNGTSYIDSCNVVVTEAEEGEG